MHKRLFTILSTIVMLSIILYIQVFADNNSTHSIVGDYFNKVFNIKLSNGSMPLDTPKNLADRERINDDILAGTS